MTNLPPGRFEEPLKPNQVPLREDPETGFPVGYNPAGENSPPGQPPVKQQQVSSPVPAPMPPQAKAPEASTYFNQGQVAEGQPKAPPGNIYDAVGNDLPEGFFDKINEDPNADLPPSVMYPSDLKQELVEQWKKRFGKDNVYIVSIVDDVWVFRGISRKEWAWIRQQGFDQETFEDQITWTCLLWPKLTPEVLEAMPGGISTSLTNYVMRYSGFNAPAVPVRL